MAPLAGNAFFVLTCVVESDEDERLRDLRKQRIKALHGVSKAQHRVERLKEALVKHRDEVAPEHKRLLRQLTSGHEHEVQARLKMWLRCKYLEEKITAQENEEHLVDRTRWFYLLMELCLLVSDIYADDELADQALFNTVLCKLSK
jgi:hypothetical protein